MTASSPERLLDFDLPEGLVATAPPENRGVARDGVRMLVASTRTGALVHDVARNLAEHLAPGDVVIRNTSSTLAASMPARRPDGNVLRVHLSTPWPNRGIAPADALAARRSLWVVELREPDGFGTAPSDLAVPGERLAMPGRASVRILGSWPHLARRSRLWLAEVRTPSAMFAWLQRHGEPIRYGYAGGAWPVTAYQTDHGAQPGSVEMPSAGRPVTHRVVADLSRHGVVVADVTLHCGVSSQEDHEPPYAEWFSVGRRTAEVVNAARARGSRVVAVGTTVVRALESATGDDGRVRAASGWTELVVTPQRPVLSVDGLLTGWHEPRASHLAMLEAVAGRDVLARSYDEALRGGYLWHEFGDVHLLLP